MIEGVNMEQVEDFKYLIVIIQSNGKQEKDIEKSC